MTDDRQTLLAQLTDPDEEVREAAREELNLIMDDDVARAFLDIARGDAAADARGDTILGLGPVVEEAGMDYDIELEFEPVPGFGPPISRATFTAIKRELRALYEDAAQPVLVRRRAFEVLVRAPEPWMSGEVRRRFATDDAEWKITAVFAMGHLARFEDQIAKVVESAEGPLLMEAVQAAGRREVGAAKKRIRELALSKEAELDLRLVAIGALPYVDGNARPILEELAEDDNGDVAEAAEAVLEEFSQTGFDDDEF